MRIKHIIMAGLLALGTLSTVTWARPGDKDAPTSKPVVREATDEDVRMEGEKRFRANCGRCHQAPHKFPPRMMLTVERHMRVRALITDEDLRLIVRYMTQ
jgi:cytochrome c5